MSYMPLKWALAALVVTVAILGSLATPVRRAEAGGATINVNTTDDEYNTDGDCSLEEAINAANSDVAIDACAAGNGADTVNVPAGTYSSVGAEGFSVFTDMYIIGAGAQSTFIDGGGLEEVFSIGTKGLVSARLEDMTIQNGADDVGAGLDVFNGATVDVQRVTLDNNVADFDGGGFVNYGNLTFIDSAITNNESLGTDSGGGGINYAGAQCPLTLAEPTSVTGYVSFNNVTISGNSADAGGGIRNDGEAFLSHVTLANNSASDGAGGIINNGCGLLHVSNTIVADNQGGNCDDDGQLFDTGINLEDTDTCGFTDMPDTDPMLAALADNGGPTMTQALLAGSPAIDTADDKTCTQTDQRGVVRPVDGDEDGEALCDIGAFEFEPGGPEPSPTPTEPPGGNPNVDVSVSDDSPEVGDTVDVSVTVTDDAGNPRADVACSFDIIDQPGDDAVLESDTGTTDADGVATVGLAVGSTPGTIQIAADCEGVTEVLEVVVSPAALPETGANGTSSSSANMLAVLLAALAAAAVLGGAGLALRRK